MSRPERGKGECHARENGWLALSTLALQCSARISAHDPDEIGDRAAADGGAR